MAILSHHLFFPRHFLRGACAQQPQHTKKKLHESKSILGTRSKHGKQDLEIDPQKPNFKKIKRNEGG